MLSDIRKKIQKKWLSFAVHKAYLCEKQLFPLRFPLPQVTDKLLLHDYAKLTGQWQKLKQDITRYPMLKLRWKKRNFNVTGTQQVPEAIEIPDLTALLSFVKENHHWQQFTRDARQLMQAFPQLSQWRQSSARKIWQNRGKWSRLICICQYFLSDPMPDRYLRELTISGVDTKFIGSHQAILKELLDLLLPASAVRAHVTGLS